MFWVRNNSTHTSVWQVLPRWILSKVDLYHLRGDLRVFETSGRQWGRSIYNKPSREYSKSWDCESLSNQWISAGQSLNLCSFCTSRNWFPHSHKESLQHLFKKKKQNSKLNWERVARKGMMNEYGNEWWSAQISICMLIGSALLPSKMHSFRHGEKKRICQRNRPPYPIITHNVNAVNIRLIQMSWSTPSVSCHPLENGAFSSVWP